MISFVLLSFVCAVGGRGAKDMMKWQSKRKFNIQVYGKLLIRKYSFCSYSFVRSSVRPSVRSCVVELGEGAG